MATTPSKGWSSKTKAPFTPRKKGLFEDGQWLCDCQPRKPALYLQVKKEGPNKGKHFYNCEKRKCSFFLWEHDAQPRERDALLRHNCRSENGIVARVQAKGDPPADPVFAPRSVPPRFPPQPAPAAPRQRIFRGLPQPDSLSMDSDEDDDSRDLSLFGGEGGRNQRDGTTRAGAAAAASFTFQQHQQHQQQPATPSIKKPPPNKRKRGGFVEDSDEEEDLFGDSDLDDPDTERQLAALAADAAAAASGGPSVKGARFADAVPAILNDEDDEDDEPTPRDPGRLLFPPKAQARGLGGSGGVGDVMGTTTTTTPTTNRKTDRLLPITPSTITTRSTSASTSTNVPTTTTTMPTTPATTPASAAIAIDHPLIADEVMTLLARQPLSADARTGVRLALERHERQVRGLARGRAAARAALEGRERCVAELQARVVALENARRMDRARLREVSEGLVRMSQEDEDEMRVGVEGY